MKKSYSKGFTLIELLVVIAIIGILSSVVLVSLNSARNKGKSAAIQTEVGQVRTALEAGYTTSYNIGTPNVTTGLVDTAAAPWNAPPLSTILTKIDELNGSRTFKVAGTSGSTGFSIYAEYDPAGYFCVASNGTTKDVSTGNAPTTAIGTADGCL